MTKAIPPAPDDLALLQPMSTEELASLVVDPDELEPYEWDDL